MGVVIVEGEGAVFGVNLEHPIVTNGDFAMQLFPDYFRQELFFMSLSSSHYVTSLSEASCCCCSCNCGHLKSVLNTDTNSNSDNYQKIIDESENSQHHFWDQVERNHEVQQRGKCEHGEAKTKHPLKSTWWNNGRDAVSQQCRHIASWLKPLYTSHTVITIYYSR